MVEKIKTLIEQSNLSNAAFLKEVGLPASAITEWSKGKAKPSLDALIKIADYFDVSIDFLIGRDVVSSEGIIVQNLHITATIKSLCKSKNISITELLQECSLTKSFIYDLEKRATSPSCEKITKIADYLNCSVDYLLGRTDDPELHSPKIYKVELKKPHKLIAFGGDNEDTTYHGTKINKKPKIT